jgi:hypothetical protein
MLIFLSVVIVLLATYILILLRWGSRVKTVCKCGAATGKFLSIVDKPMEAITASPMARRWTPADFGNLLPEIVDSEK